MSNPEISLNITMTMEQLVDAISCLRHEDILGLIKEIDFMAQNWDFTQMCYDYFKEEMETEGFARELDKQKTEDQNSA